MGKTLFQVGDLVNVLDGEGVLQNPKPVKILGELGEKDGVIYYSVEGTSTGYTADRLELADQDHSNGGSMPGDTEYRSTRPAAPSKAKLYHVPPARLQTNDVLPWDVVQEALEQNEQGDADLLHALYDDRIIFDVVERKWFLWNGHHWEEDETLFVSRLVSAEVAGQYSIHSGFRYREGTEESRKLAKDLWKRASSLRNKRKIDSVLDLSHRGTTLALPGGRWDADPWLLGCANGVIDLQTGEMHKGEPGDRIRTVSPTVWLGLDYLAPRFEMFVNEIFGHDAELVSFVQRLLGYGLAGLSTEHVLPIFWGIGRNGKDTLLSALKEVLGPVMSPVGAEALVGNSKNPNAATPYTYALQFLRIAWVNETNEGARLNAGQVKWLTGGGELTGRLLNRNPVTFTPRHMLILMTNYKPHAPSDDYALWKRLLLIPFEQLFIDDPDPSKPNEHKRDIDLPGKLKAEATGILAWLVRGCLAWQREGLKPPESVRQATKDYKQEEDDLSPFFDELCVFDPNVKIKASILYGRYRDWCDQYGIKPMSLTAFGKRIAKHEIGKDSTRGGVFYLGIDLRPGEEQKLSEAEVQEQTREFAEASTGQCYVCMTRLETLPDGRNVCPVCHPKGKV